jgi:hypothetical protein
LSDRATDTRCNRIVVGADKNHIFRQRELQLAGRPSLDGSFCMG